MVSDQYGTERISAICTSKAEADKIQSLTPKPSCVLEKILDYYYKEVDRYVENRKNPTKFKNGDIVRVIEYMPQPNGFPSQWTNEIATIVEYVSEDSICIKFHNPPRITDKYVCDEIYNVGACDLTLECK